jgi:hypothetical protein
VNAFVGGALAAPFCWPAERDQRATYSNRVSLGYTLEAARASARNSSITVSRVDQEHMNL